MGPLPSEKLSPRPVVLYNPFCYGTVVAMERTPSFRPKRKHCSALNSNSCSSLETTPKPTTMATTITITRTTTTTNAASTLERLRSISNVDSVDIRASLYYLPMISLLHKQFFVGFRAHATKVLRVHSLRVSLSIDGCATSENTIPPLESYVTETAFIHIHARCSEQLGALSAYIGGERACATPTVSRHMETTFVILIPPMRP